MNQADRGDIVFHIAIALSCLGMGAVCVAAAGDSPAWQWSWVTAGLVLALLGLVGVVAGFRMMRQGEGRES